MSIGQNLRLLGSKVKNIFTFGKKGDEFATTDAAPNAAGASATIPKEKKKFNLKGFGIFLLFMIIPLYYIIGSLLTHRINDDLNFKVGTPQAGKSITVEVMAGLIDREVNKTKWSPNIQAFEPAALLRIGGNMVNFQTGIVRSLATVTFEMESRLARVRGTSSEDPDMAAARQGLSRSADTWLWAGADGEYRKAHDALIRYNNRLANGQAVFEIRADNLQGVLDKIALDLGGISDNLENQVLTGRRMFIDTRADKVFYYSKGQAYAYFIILRALREDYRSVLQERHVEKLYDAMLADLALAADMKPLIVQNANTDGAILPNHLVGEGFYILRSRAKLREITDILLK